MAYHKRLLDLMQKSKFNSTQNQYIPKKRKPPLNFTSETASTNLRSRRDSNPKPSDP